MHNAALRWARIQRHLSPLMRENPRPTGTLSVDRAFLPLVPNQVKELSKIFISIKEITMLDELLASFKCALFWKSCGYFPASSFKTGGASPALTATRPTAGCTTP